MHPKAGTMPRMRRLPELLTVAQRITKLINGPRLVWQLRLDQLACSRVYLQVALHALACIACKAHRVPFKPAEAARVGERLTAGYGLLYGL